MNGRIRHVQCIPAFTEHLRPQTEEQRVHGGEGTPRIRVIMKLADDAPAIYPTTGGIWNCKQIRKADFERDEGVFAARLTLEGAVTVSNWRMRVTEIS
jgi:hypothetical protein